MKPNLLAILVLVLSTLVVKSQSTAPAPLILPPPVWETNKHILFSLVNTNKSGEYPLQPTWVGVENVTARSGFFTNQLIMKEETNPTRHFDQFTVHSADTRPPYVHSQNLRYLNEAALSGHDAWDGFAYLTTLPTDKELLEIRDPSALTNYTSVGITFPKKDKADPSSRTSLGGSYFGLGGSYFTLGPYDSINTVRFEFIQMEGSSKIDGVIVRRGHFHQ